MWYRYIDRANYDTVRIWRYLLGELDAAISISMPTTTV